MNSMKRAVSELENEKFPLLKAHLSLVVYRHKFARLRVSQFVTHRHNISEYLDVICTPWVSVVCHCQSLAQQALMGTINSSMQAVQQAQSDLGYVDNPPPLGHDLVSLL